MTEHPNDHNSQVSEDAIIAVQLSKLKRAKADSKTAQGDLKGMQNSLDASGLNLKAAAEALKIVASGKAQKKINEIIDLLKYLRILGKPLVADQLEMFQSVPVEPGILEQALADGLQSGRAGEDRYASPHDLNSDSGREWTKGFDQGEKEREIVLSLETGEGLIKGDGESQENAGQSEVEKSILASA